MKGSKGLRLDSRWEILLLYVILGRVGVLLLGPCELVVVVPVLGPLAFVPEMLSVRLSRTPSHLLRTRNIITNAWQKRMHDAVWSSVLNVLSY